MAASKLTLKLLIDKEGQRVLFAEAGKDFIDFLFCLVVLPVGTGNRDIVGGLSKLYKSVSVLSNNYIQSNQNNVVILKPKSSLPFLYPKVPLLPTEAFSPPNSPPYFHKCGHCNMDNILSTLFYPCGACGRTMEAKEGGFVKGLVAYMVVDDLAVSPMSTIS